MTNVMKLCGFVLTLGSIVLGILTFVMPGKMDVYGIKLDTAAILLIGGILALGLGGVMDRLGALRNLGSTAVTTPDAETTVIPVPASMPNFGRKATEAATAAAAVTAGAVAMVETSSSAVAEVAPPAANTSVAETISALEQAKADVLKSMGGMDAMTSSAPEPKPAHVETAKPAALHVVEDVEEPDAVDEVEAGDLYVVEEKVIRGRPARILSDDTVEAETEEGWMRFENLDHLNEYLDSVEEQSV